MALHVVASDAVRGVEPDDCGQQKLTTCCTVEKLPVTLPSTHHCANNPNEDTFSVSEAQAESGNPSKNVSSDKSRSNSGNQKEVPLNSLSSLRNLQPSTYTGPLHPILDMIPANYQVISVENIMRPDLAALFDTSLTELMDKYAHQAKQQPEDYSVTPVFAFHGTDLANIPDIVKLGLQVPSKENGITMAHSAIFGVGIYLSEDPESSISFCDNHENVVLLICCVALGKMMKTHVRGFDPAMFDSIVKDGYYVVFNSNQVLPCYAIRVVSKRILGRVTDMQDFTLHSSVQVKDHQRETESMKRERLTAKARKHLPYGFGPPPSRGKEMVVIDAADSSDDEEETIGNFQDFRL